MKKQSVFLSAIVLLLVITSCEKKGDYDVSLIKEDKNPIRVSGVSNLYSNGEYFPILTSLNVSFQYKDNSAETTTISTNILGEYFYDIPYNKALNLQKLTISPESYSGVESNNIRKIHTTQVLSFQSGFHPHEDIDNINFLISYKEVLNSVASTENPDDLTLVTLRWDDISPLGYDVSIDGNSYRVSENYITFSSLPYAFTVYITTVGEETTQDEFKFD